ncbi:MAG: MOFRL family protein [Gammaproteobacteria bacterium]
MARGEDGGFDAEDCLRRVDAGDFLEASGDLIHTGPTGTNVMDLMIAYKSPDQT